jgi:hypothetical protein
MTVNILHITTVPSNADIYTDISSNDIENMVYRGKSPMNANIYNGIRRVVAKKDGYYDSEQTIELVEGIYDNYMDIALVPIDDDLPYVLETDKSGIPVLPIILGSGALLAGIAIVIKKKK